MCYTTENLRILPSAHSKCLGDAAVFSRHLGQSRSGGGGGREATLGSGGYQADNNIWHLEFLPLPQNPQLSREEGGHAYSPDASREVRNTAVAKLLSNIH